jgi:hypothetical protein
VNLIGFFNLETTQALSQFVKGIVKWLIHFGFLIVGVVYLLSRTRAFYWRTLSWFLGGIAVNAAYGIVQLLAAQAGHNLDSIFVKPLTRGASQINLYGAVNGTNVYRPNALTGDPNHLAIMALLPLLILTPIYLRLERGNRWRIRLAVVLALLLIAVLATLSRSGALGLVVGAIVLALPYRHLLVSRLAVLPLTLVVIPVRRRHPLAAFARHRRLDAPRRLQVHPEDPPLAPVLRARLQQLLGLLPVRHRQDELGAALVLRGAHSRGRARRDGAVRGLPLVHVRPARRGPSGREGARRGT